MALRGQGRQGLRALLQHQAHRPAAGAQEAGGCLLRSSLPALPLCADGDAGWRRRVSPRVAPAAAAAAAAAAAPDTGPFGVNRGSLAGAAAPGFARWHGSRAELRCHARGFAAAAGGDEPPGPSDGNNSSEEWLDSSDDDESSSDEEEESEEEEEGSDEDSDDDDEEEGVRATFTEDELARMELEDPLAYAFAMSQEQEYEGYGLPPLEDILAGDDEEAEERAARRESEEAMQKESVESRVRKVDSQGRAYATGKRKSAIARVWLRQGDGVVTVNGRALDAYFPDIKWRTHVVFPFVVTDTVLMFDANVFVQGGGPSGQAQAVRLGLAKALQAFDPDWRQPLRSHGLITRDSRVVERKKPGKAKARKSFQWVKR